jgi:hypothetical protein
MKDGKISHRFTVTNESDQPALVRKLYTSCMCTKAALLLNDGKRIGPFGMAGHDSIPEIDQPIRPGQSVVVEAVFDPNAHGPAGIGRNDRAVVLQLANNRALELHFTAYVTP